MTASTGSGTATSASGGVPGSRCFVLVYDVLWPRDRMYGVKSLEERYGGQLCWRRYCAVVSVDSVADL